MKLSRTYLKTSHPYAYATFTDREFGKGLLQIHSDWGIYHASWDSTGREHLEEFVLGVDSGYLSGCLSFWSNFMRPKAGAHNLLTNFLAHCWPELKEIIKTEFAVYKRDGNI